MMTTKIIRRYSLITILLIVSIFISLCVGSVMIHPIDAIKGIFTQDDFILNDIVYLEHYLVLLSVVAWLYQVQLYKL